MCRRIYERSKPLQKVSQKSGERIEKEVPKTWQSQ
jgi:predicted DNA-binding antitoxin AbrB/MazE fold protein